MAPVSVECLVLRLRFPKERKEDLPKMDPIHTFHLSEKVKQSRLVLLIMEDEYQDLIMHLIRKGTRKSHETEWCQFRRFCLG